MTSSGNLPCRRRCENLIRRVTSSLVAAALGLYFFGAFAQTTNISLVPVADAFLRAAAPQDNYGRAGSLTVGGASATNGFGVPGGRFDSLLRFLLTDAVASLDNAFGSHDWFVARAVLRVNEVADPANALFPRGALGPFELRWLAEDMWTEGTGSPSVPTRDGVAFQDLPSLLNERRDELLGNFTNSGSNGPVMFDLSLPPAFLEDLRAGGEVTLYLRPASDVLGFVFNSRNFVMESARPRLELTVVAGPPPRIAAVERTHTGELIVRFNTRSNWTHVLQYCDALSTNVGTMWANLLSAPAQPFDGQMEVLDTVTNRQRFYRLGISPQ